MRLMVQFLYAWSGRVRVQNLTERHDAIDIYSLIPSQNKITLFLYGRLSSANSVQGCTDSAIVPTWDAWPSLATAKWALASAILNRILWHSSPKEISRTPAKYAFTWSSLKNPKLHRETIPWMSSRRWDSVKVIRYHLFPQDPIVKYVTQQCLAPPFSPVSSSPLAEYRLPFPLAL